MAPPLFGLVSRVQALVILHTRYTQKTTGVGGASWRVWLECPLHPLEFYFLHLCDIIIIIFCSCIVSVILCTVATCTTAYEKT